MYPCKTPACINPVSALNRTCRNCINEQGQQRRILNQALPTDDDSPSLSRQTSRYSSHSEYAAGSSSAGHPPPAPQMPPPQSSRAGSSDSRPHHPSSHHQTDEITPAQPRDSSNQHKRFKCEECDMPFTKSGDRNRHVRTVHRNERRFKCEECAASFGQKNNLERHVTAVHRKEKEHQCGGCGISFADISNLRKHQRQTCPNLKAPQQRNAGAGLSEHPRPTPPPSPPSKRPRLS
jgi:uncharacterized C2H2 Zn-finger protein